MPGLNQRLLAFESVDWPLGPGGHYAGNEDMKGMNGSSMTELYLLHYKLSQLTESPSHPPDRADDEEGTLRWSPDMIVIKLQS